MTPDTRETIIESLRRAIPEESAAKFHAETTFAEDFIRFKGILVSVLAREVENGVAGASPEASDEYLWGVHDGVMSIFRYILTLKMSESAPSE